MDTDYLYKGLCALASAHKANAMAGHLGAALVAGYLFGEGHPDIETQISAELERILRGEETVWYDPEKVGIPVPQLFAPFPEEPPAEEAVPVIADALEPGVDRLRQSGHNAIFASLAIRSLSEHPEYATPDIVEGIRLLIASFAQAGPGSGYYGEQRGRRGGDEVELSAEEEPPVYDSVRAVADAAVDELIASSSLRRQGFGGLFHILNHAAALVDLERQGFGELARRGLPAHRRHILLWRSLPDLEAELGPLVPAGRDPLTPAYWSRRDSAQFSAWITHRVKTLYGFCTLTRLIADADKRARAREAFLYLMV